MEGNEKLEQARQRLKESLSTASPELKKVLKEALEETCNYFKRPEVMEQMSSTICQTKAALESGKFKEIIEEFKLKHGLSNDTKLTDDMKRKLAEELANGIFHKE